MTTITLKQPIKLDDGSSTWYLENVISYEKLGENSVSVKVPEYELVFPKDMIICLCHKEKK